MNIQDFTAVLLERHRGDLDASAWGIAHDAFKAGEFEVAAISVIEDARNVSVEEVDMLESLAAAFDLTDAEIARRVCCNFRVTF